MHAGVVDIAVFWLCVGNCCHSDETIIIKKHLQRITASHQHIYSHVKLEPIQEQRFMYVFLYNTSA